MIYDRSLVNACSLVGTLELKELILVDSVVFSSSNLDMFSIDIFNCTCVLCKKNYAGVACSLILNT